MTTEIYLRRPVRGPPIQGLWPESALNLRGCFQGVSRARLHNEITCDYADIEVRVLSHVLLRGMAAAPKRKRRKRLAKKIARRGGMLHVRGVYQDFVRAWPELAWWWMR